jgi:2-haloacid dehalogenase
MAPAAFDFEPIEVLTFDCYGTLIDWEAGLLAGLRAVLDEAAADVTDDELLEAYAVHEAAAEGGPWMTYREVLARALGGVCERYRYRPSLAQASQFVASVGDWPPFPDAAESLARLGRRFKLGVITNCDDDLFAASNRRLGEPFRWVVTAERARSYKPALRNFQLALELIGRPPQRIVHVAQSLYHDHLPASRLGLATAWIDRRRGRPGFGATPPACARPDIVVADMSAFADLALDWR